MARAPTGSVVEKATARATVYALRFRASGRRQYVTLGTSSEGWTRSRAETELANVLADVRRGIWRPPEREPVIEQPREEPTFHVFASEWLDGRKKEGLAERTTDELAWALTLHLLPHFADFRLSRVTAEEVDRFKRSKVAERELRLVERPLSNRSINRVISILASVLDAAVEYGWMGSNPARGRRRRLKAEPRRRSSMNAEQVRALLQAGGRHRLLLATAIMAGGLRASELTGLRWRDLDLAGAWLHVRESKTEAGVRRVDLAPDLLDDLKAWKAETPFARDDDYVFPTSKGTRRERNTLRTRILYPAIERADATLVDAGRQPIGEHVTFHSLRRTYARLMAEAGADPRYVMGQIGHTRAEFTLAVYTDVGDRKHAANARLGELLLGADEGRQWALNGHYEHEEAATESGGQSLERPEVRDMQALPEWS